MTIGDFIAGLLEKRRKKFEERYKHQNSFWENEDSTKDSSEYYGNLDDQLNDVLRMFGLDTSTTGFPNSFSPPISFDEKVDQDLDGKITRSDIKSFFKKRSDADTNSPRSRIIRSGMSQSSKIIRNPDGTVQVETIIRDNLGNVERRVSYKKDDKVYTVITKTDPFGKKIEENVSENNDVLIPGIKSYWNSNGNFVPDSNDSDSEYNYWFNKFFKKEAPTLDSVPFDSFSFPKQIEQQIERITKKFEPESPLDSFNNKTWKPANKPSLPKDDANMKSLVDGFMKQNGIADNDVFDEMNNLLESMEDQKKNMFGQRVLKNDISRDKGRKFRKTPSSIFPKKPTLFYSIDELSKLETDENPPFDKFIEPDEEKIEKRKLFLEQTKEALERLHKFFQSSEQINSQANTDKNVQNSRQEVDLLLPEVPIKRTEPKFEIFKKPFSQHSLNNGYVTSQIYFSDGKSRKETIRRSDDGTTEKIVTYVIGDKSYVINTKTDRFGQQHNVKQHINMNEDDVKSFSRVWGEKYKSDFED